MTENEFLLADRIQKIKSMNELYDLENNAYISFSGGKDSTVLSHLIDEALPNNHIPRVFINTGIEYKLLVAFVEREREGLSYRNYCPETEHKADFRAIWLSVQKQGAFTTG
jgi:3'-phosphoadenosine 5'-phosphosulfate sulfotransferase (PAPS reductase)/FAD synthetase